MCVVALALAAHPKWQLVVAGNRDEFHTRAAAPLARWTDAPHVLSGRDLVSGGGWIGVSDARRFAVVTNVAGYPRDGDAPSRGALVADYLRDGSLPADDMLGAFGGFSLLTIGDDASFRTNRPAIERRPLAPGLHGIANGPLDPPSPRTRTLTMALAEWIASTRPASAVLDLLADEAPAGERPVFIRDGVYGTRCSTVIAVDTAGNGMIVERRFGPAGVPDGETRLDFSWR
ncbi:NRDE family protein [Sphingomonas radiodurans]|uniref:NRDE family protein n=1 Tax=Sphingomonas radiodurans TaxID=2890321 RepID=UPI001E5895E6|nr:NRDE family protein [Sphingomonas radiodurans]WBH15349.1 NRDE family protein [Sphingomonas radiodurans]